GAEYRYREEELRRFLSEWKPEGCPGENGIGFESGRYDPQEYYTCVKGLEQEPEGGERCRACFLLRLEETAKTAKAQGFDCFDTTLTVSPYKNYAVISKTGQALAGQYGIEYLAGNYKKQDGYRRSIELSRGYGLYRQDYCGCEFSKAEAEQRRAKRRAEEHL
ncbi:MAG: epoxyqueuosine reductase QueH, partial [Firmicutes bacterium]|nr:epoxyqueuosine reductase QueH [Bacillota bacterium]